MQTREVVVVVAARSQEATRDFHGVLEGRRRYLLGVVEIFCGQRRGSGAGWDAYWRERLLRLRLRSSGGTFHGLLECSLATGVSLPFHVAETGSQDGLRGNRRGAHIVGSIRAVVLGRIEAQVEFVWALSFPVHFFFS